MMMEAAVEKLKGLVPVTVRSGGKKEKSIGLWALYQKEMADHIHSKRFLLILGLVVVTSFASLYGALDSISSAAEGTDFLFLKLFTTSGNSIPSFVSFIAILGPFVGLVLGFDAINSERNGGKGISSEAYVSG